MENLLFILLGIGMWQLVVTIIIFLTNDEEKVFSIGIGIVGWLIYGIALSFAKITKFYSTENQAKRIIKSAKKELKKKTQNWKKWYKKYGKYSSKVWNVVRKDNADLIVEMKNAGFDYSNSK